jgi:hypothetical protein
VPTLPREIPERLRRSGRPEDQAFGPDELLYRRYLQEHWVNGQFTGLGFRFPRQSVNRQRYSEPEDVLFLEDGTFDDEWGVLEFAVRDIPPRLPEQGFPGFVFFPKHVPLEMNFAHSELWCDHEQRTGGYVEPGTTVKKFLRAKLSQRVFPRIPARK